MDERFVCCREGDELFAHYCSRVRDFVGDPTMAALEFEIAYGDPAREEGPR